MLNPEFLKKIFFYVKNPHDFSNLNQTCRYFYALTSRMYNKENLGTLWQQQRTMRSSIDILRGKNGFDGWINHVSETVRNLKTQQEEIQKEIQKTEKQKNEITSKINQIFLEEFKKIDVSGLFVAGLLIDVSRNPGVSLPDHLASFIGLPIEAKQELQIEFEKQLKVKDHLQWLKERLEENYGKIVRQSADLNELNTKLNTYVSKWGSNGKMLEGQYPELCKKVLTAFVNFEN